jgi:hypothetical protein
MLRFYTNREVSTKLETNLARWKRWSREFLPPDPLGGLQSGVARRYSVDEAFTVYLGGFLVSRLRFGIPEARCILSDLKECFTAVGVLANALPHARYQESPFGSADHFTVLILPQSTTSTGGGGFRYILRGLISRRISMTNGIRLVEETVCEECIPSECPPPGLEEAQAVALLPLTTVLADFAAALGLEPRHFALLKRCKEA